MDQPRDRDEMPSEFDEPERPRQDDVKNSADDFEDEGEGEFGTDEQDDADTAE